MFRLVVSVRLLLNRFRLLHPLLKGLSLIMNVTSFSNLTCLLPMSLVRKVLLPCRARLRVSVFPQTTTPILSSSHVELRPFVYSYHPLDSHGDPYLEAQQMEPLTASI